MDMADLKEVASRDGFTLYELPDGANGWKNLKLVKHEPGRRKWGTKRNWWLGWNGERLARKRDAEILAKYNPELEAWVIETLQARDHVTT